MPSFLKSFYKKNSNSIREISFSVLISLVIAAFVIFFTDITYHLKKITKRGFEIETAGSSTALAKKEEKPIELADLMKIADLARGEKIFKKCASCHNIAKGEGSKVGPNLFGILGRNRGSFMGFNYSSAMKAKGGKWDRESINEFITKPSNYLPGTKMAFAGLKKPQDRADVILYLENQR